MHKMQSDMARVREFKGTETHGHAMTRKGTPLKASVFRAYLPKNNHSLEVVSMTQGSWPVVYV